MTICLLWPCCWLLAWPLMSCISAVKNVETDSNCLPQINLHRHFLSTVAAVLVSPLHELTAPGVEPSSVRSLQGERRAKGGAQTAAARGTMPLALGRRETWSWPEILHGTQSTANLPTRKPATNWMHCGRGTLRRLGHTLRPSQHATRRCFAPFPCLFPRQARKARGGPGPTAGCWRPAVHPSADWRSRQTPSRGRRWF